MDNQARVLHLQAEEMAREDSLRHWSLLVQYTSGVMKVAFELAGALALTALAVVIGVAMYNAANEDGVIIEAFSVPSDLANKGITGQAVAAQILDRLSYMQSATRSSRPAASYSNNWHNDIKVQIPNTGVSISDAYRLLASWLGHQTVVSGEVYRTDTGLAVTARATGVGGATVTGTDKQLANLLSQAAETIYEETQPFRYATYRINTRGGRDSLARSLFESLAASDSVEERFWAYGGLRAMDQFKDWRLPRADALAQIAIKPDSPIGYANLLLPETVFGHDEAVVSAAQKIAGLASADTTAAGRAFVRNNSPTYRARVAVVLADYPAAIAAWIDAQHSARPDVRAAARTSFPVLYALVHDPAGSDPAFDRVPRTPTDEATRTIAAVIAGDWQRAIRSAQTAGASYRRAGYSPLATEQYLYGFVHPWVAFSYAQLGEFARAHAEIDHAPLDNYSCTYVRGVIASLEHNWRTADYWFGRAIAQAPSIGIAFYRWGESYAARGDFDDAIAKLIIAHAKAPHYAEPLELWGEILVAKNRSDLSLVKFQEAAQYAPNWGRLHLKWGEALLWLGRKEEARAQFAIASSLYLSDADHAQLLRVRHV
ncbi:MAG: hypothetical protein JO294_10930 [Alphaproteobacteria bacterium]|nr:hypothetical protein [Alphaproteobacteria bacterium]